MPPLHAVQAAAPGCAAVPAAHIAQPAAPEDDAAEPAGHPMQPVAPDALEKAPGGQGAHAAPRKLAFAKDPGAHNTQARVATDAAEPGGHCVELDTHDAPLGALSWPGAQAIHAVVEIAASATLKSPGGQNKHVDSADAPTVAEYLPATHAVQVVAPGGAQKPAAQHTPAPAPEPVFKAQGRHAEDEVAEGDTLKRPAAQGRQAAGL